MENEFGGRTAGHTVNGSNRPGRLNRSHNDEFIVPILSSSALATAHRFTVATTLLL